MSPTKTTSSQPLTDLSPNTTSPAKATSAHSHEPLKADLDKMPATKSFPIHNAHTTNYISPSDNMMSPATKKLSEIKGRRFATAKTSVLGSKALFANLKKREELSGSETATSTDSEGS